MEYVRKIAQLERESNNLKVEINHTDDRQRFASQTMVEEKPSVVVSQPQQPIVVAGGCPHGPNVCLSYFWLIRKMVLFHWSAHIATVEAAIIFYTTIKK